MQARPLRFEIQKPVEYSVRTETGQLEGRGRTLNISRRGILFESPDEIGVGRKIDLVVEMGDAIGIGAMIQLRVQGITVRYQDGSVAVSIKRYQLESAPAPSLETADETV